MTLVRINGRSGVKAGRSFAFHGLGAMCNTGGSKYASAVHPINRVVSQSAKKF